MRFIPRSLILFAILRSAVGRYLDDDLPLCSRTTVMEGKVREIDSFGGKENEYSAVQLQMGLKETSCVNFKMNDSSTMLHAFEFLRLEQHHPISGEYTFAIPKITSTCICDCFGGETHCVQNDYHYKNCSSGSLCVRTYHPSQSNVGCLSGSKSEACCQLSLDPYKDMTFKAVQLSQPDTIIVFRYRIYDRINKMWRISSDDYIEVPMNKGIAKFDLNRQHKIELVVSGSAPSRGLSPGMYFIREGTSELRGGISLNSVGETSLEKLGWFRREGGKWDVRKGLVRITQAHHINVMDCKQQKYTSTFNGEQMVSSINGEEFINYDLGRAVSEDPWIETAYVEGRVVRVEHADGISVSVSLLTTTRPFMLRSASQFRDFNGTIHLDKASNRYLNLTFQQARGTLIGQVYLSESKQHSDIVFSVQTDSSRHDFRSIISVPSSVNGSRFVCFHPSGDVEGERCKWLNFHSLSLPSFSRPDRWQWGRGECHGCNERGVEQLLAQLDPRTWFDGINSMNEMMVILLEGAIGVVLFICLVLTCTKCVFPLCRCGIAIAKPLKIGNK